MITQLVASSVIRRLSVRQFVRAFSTPVPSSEKPAAASNASSGRIDMSITHKPNNFEKKVLVWTGKYKSTEDIPDYVNQEVMDRAANRFRIRIANVMMVITIVGCILMVMSGKEAADRGESVQKMNQDWHVEYNEKSKQEALEAQKKK